MSKDEKPKSEPRKVKPESGDEQTAPEYDPRFQQPTPSPWKRAALLMLVGLLFWLAFTLRRDAWHSNKVIHAQRYSKEYKFRPAASPVITERLKDGRVRLRGAQPKLP